MGTQPHSLIDMIRSKQDQQSLLEKYKTFQQTHYSERTTILTNVKTRFTMMLNLNDNNNNNPIMVEWNTESFTEIYWFSRLLDSQIFLNDFIHLHIFHYILSKLCILSHPSETIKFFVSEHLLTHSFIQHIFIKCLSYAEHSDSPRGFGSENHMHNFHPQRVLIVSWIWEVTGHQTDTSKDSNECSKEREHGSIKIFDDRILRGWDHVSVTWKYRTWTNI